MNGCRHLTRRDALRATLAAGAMAALRPTFGRAAVLAAGPDKGASRVALTTGADHAQMIFEGLRLIKDDVAHAIGDRPIVIKPNNVAIDRQLAATPAQSIEGILEFLKSIGKCRDVIIAESAANGPTFEGFSNYGYNPLAQKYGAKLVDLDQADLGVVRVIDQKDFQPHSVRVAKLMLDRNVFVISAAKMKTHDRVVATLSLKNIVVGAPVKHLDFRWGRAKAGTWTDKPLIHGNGFHGLQYNLYAMASTLRPDLAVIDGFEAMEGNGPTNGTPVPHRVAVSSLDWLAADRVAVALMGISLAKMGYLSYCAAAGLGETDMARMEILGARVADHVRTYKLADNVDKQLLWMKPLAEEG